MPLLDLAGDIVGFFLLVFLMSGFICAQMAKDRGRSAWAWGCLGLMLGPIAFLIIFLISPDYKAIEQRGVEEGLMRRCPRCAEWVRKEANLCRYCGSELASLED